MTRTHWGVAAAIATYCLALISVDSAIGGGFCPDISASLWPLGPICNGAEDFVVYAWPILAFIVVWLWMSKWKIETSGENGTRFGKIVVIVFAVVAACVVWVGQLAIGSRLYPFTITARNSLDLFLVEVAATVLAGLALAIWTK
jgi:hypothetical protein